MHVDLSVIKEEVDIDDTKIKLEPEEEAEEEMADSTVQLSRGESLKILEEGSDMITVPARDRQSEHERRIILDPQQLFVASSEGQIKPFECDICHFVADTHMEISAHMVNHQMNRHFCHQGCGVWMNSLEMVLEHEYHQHSQPELVLCCRTCNFMAEDTDSLDTHMQRHFHAYRFVCAICRRHFESSQVLELHWKTTQSICSKVQFMEGPISRAEFVTTVSSEVQNDVQIKDEVCDAEELEANAAIIVKSEPDDDDMQEACIKTEPLEQTNNTSSIWSQIPDPLRSKLRLPALKSNLPQSVSKIVKCKDFPDATASILKAPDMLKPLIDNIKDVQTAKPQKKPIAANILKILPGNCMVIKLPPNTKIVKIPGQASNSHSVPEKSAIPKIPQEITISQVKSATNTDTVFVPVTSPVAGNRNTFHLIDSFNNTESRPESMKIITEFRNQIRSIEQTLPLPGTVLQSARDRKSIPLPPVILPSDAPKPVELILSPLSIMVVKELRLNHPLYRFLWTCPLCQRSYEQNNAFRMHIIAKHNLSLEKLNRLIVTLQPHKILPEDSLPEALNVPVPSKNIPEYKLKLPDISATPDKSTILSQLTTHAPQTLAKPLPLKGRSASIQSKTNDFQCTECSKVFTTQGALRIHKTIHTGELPHKCDFCDKRFRTPGQVRVHHRRHTGEKPFKCKICSLEFTHRETLISHLSRHIGMKRYKCYGCDKYFVVVSGLRAHRRLRPDTCGKVKFTARAHGPRVRVIRGEVVFEHHPDHNGYLRSEDPLNILSERRQVDSTTDELAERKK